MDKVKTFFFLSVTLMLLWLMLVGTTRSDELLTGALVSIVITIIFLASAIHAEMKLNPKAILYVPVYFVVFTLALIKSNLDVAYRVVAPSLPIKPGIVKVKTKLKSRVGRITLANSITLTPGTLTVEVKDDEYYIHWINVTGKNVEESTEEIVRGFEKYLEVIFG